MRTHLGKLGAVAGLLAFFVATCYAQMWGTIYRSYAFDDNTGGTTDTSFTIHIDLGDEFPAALVSHPGFAHMGRLRLWAESGGYETDSIRAVHSHVTTGNLIDTTRIWAIYYDSHHFTSPTDGYAPVWTYIEPYFNPALPGGLVPGDSTWIYFVLFHPDSMNVGYLPVYADKYGWALDIDFIDVVKSADPDTRMKGEFQVFLAWYYDDQTEMLRQIRDQLGTINQTIPESVRQVARSIQNQR